MNAIAIVILVAAVVTAIIAVAQIFIGRNRGHRPTVVTGSLTLLGMAFVIAVILIDTA